MDTQDTLTKNYLLTYNSDIKEGINKSNIVIATINLLLGFGLFFLSDSISDKTSGAYIATLTFPFLLLFVALYLLLCRRKRLIYSSTGSAILKGHLYFDKSELPILKSMLKADQSANIEWPEFHHNGNARLSFMVSKDAKFAALQLYEFVPYNYETASDIYYFSAPSLHPIAQLLLQKQQGH